MNSRHLIGAAALVAVGLFCCAPVATASVDETVLASRANGPAGAQANSFSEAPTTSDDGCRVAFVSGANNLTADNLAGAAQIQVYLRDVCNGTTRLASRATGPSGAPQNNGCGGGSTTPAISGDGTKVVWASQADNLTALPAATPTGGSGFPCEDVYIRDLTNDTTTLVSANSANTQRAGYAEAFGMGSSADGTYVAWSGEANASTLDPTAIDTNQGCCGGFGTDVFRTNTSSGNTQLVSRIATSNTTGNGASGFPSISNDGSRVAFESGATNLVSGDTNGQFDVLVRDLSAATTQLVSRGEGPAGAIADNYSQHALVSADGNTVGFESGATNLVAGTVIAQNAYVRDLDSGHNELINRISGTDGQPQQFGTALTSDPSGDGRFVTFTAIGTGSAPLAEGTVQGWNTYLRDRANQTTFILSRATGGIGAADNIGGGTSASIAANGRFAAFWTLGNNLFPGDTNGQSDIVRREFAEPAEVSTAADVNLRLLAGTASIAGTPFEHSTNVPVGTAVDATNGRIELTSEFSGTKQSARFFDGSFTVSQSLADPVPTFDLPAPTGCPTTPATLNPKKKKRHKKKNKKKLAANGRSTGSSLWGSGKGHYRTRGHRGSAAVRGTTWQTEDTCAGTRFTVTDGILDIDDFGLPGSPNLALAAPGSYLAPAPTPAAVAPPKKKKKHKNKRGK